MKYWLMKSEANCYPIELLEKEKNQTTYWDGVRNYQARNFIRDEMKVGDKVIFFHSNGAPSGAAGVCEVVKEAYPDFTAFDPENPHYDPKSKKDNPAWMMVDVKLIKKFKNFVSIESMRQNKKLQKMQLLKQGNRLSVMPITKEEFEVIVSIGNL
ncbi:MAG: EVE domain-containing protein [Bacteroidota bacterium]